MKINTLLCVGLTMLSFGAIAAPVCVHSGTKILSLSKDDTSAVITNHPDGDKWMVTVGYETYPGSNVIDGPVTCSDTFGTYGVVNTGLNELVIETTGANCWCRMTFPMSSYWIFAFGGNCTIESCVSACANAYKNDANFRETMIDAMW